MVANPVRACFSEMFPQYIAHQTAPQNQIDHQQPSTNLRHGLATKKQNRVLRSELIISAGGALLFGLCSGTRVIYPKKRKKKVSSTFAGTVSSRALSCSVSFVRRLPDKLMDSWRQLHFMQDEFFSARVLRNPQIGDIMRM